MHPHLTLYEREQISSFVHVRKNEVHIGEALTCMDGSKSISENLQAHKNNNGVFVLLGVPEDIGPRANLGRGGSDKAWPAFLARFCNLQSNQFINASDILLLGELNCTDLMKKSRALDVNKESELAALRLLCGEIDSRLAPVITLIVEHGLVPIVIGGGHNNAYPIIKGCAAALKQPLAVANFDPHSDFRPLEGRHSGNGFSYAAAAGALGQYYVVGLHEYKNSQSSIEGLQKYNFNFDSYQAIWVRREKSLSESISQVKEYLSAKSSPVGIEVDMDTISFMPVSAYSNCGASVSDVEQYVYSLATLPNATYLHLCECAPEHHPSNINQGNSDVGQALSALVLAFIQGRGTAKQNNSQAN